MFHILGIFSYKDCIELIIIIIITYYFSNWLLHELGKKYIGYSFMLASIAMLSYIFHFAVITMLLIWFTPIIAVLFTLYHQKLLQQNFIAKKISLKSATTPSLHWIDQLMQCALNAANEGKSYRFVIESTDQLEAYIVTQCPVQIIPHAALLQFIIGNSDPNNGFIWFTHSGKLMGLNCSWTSAGTIINNQIADECILLSNKFDCIFLESRGSRLFSIIAQGNCVEQLTAIQARDIIKRTIEAGLKKINKQGDILYGAQIDGNHKSYHNQCST